MIDKEVDQKKTLWNESQGELTTRVDKKMHHNDGEWYGIDRAGDDEPEQSIQQEEDTRSKLGAPVQNKMEPGGCSKNTKEGYKAFDDQPDDNW
jgi:hypothetical protein